LYGAVSPKDGTCVYLILPAPDTECFQIFLETLAKKYPRQLILLFVDGAGNHQSEELEVPQNIILHLLPPYSPELNPQENLWGEIREKIFKNYALKSMDEVHAKLDDAALYIERNPALVKSITSFPYILSIRVWALARCLCAADAHFVDDDRRWSGARGASRENPTSWRCCGAAGTVAPTACAGSRWIRLFFLFYILNFRKTAFGASYASHSTHRTHRDLPFRCR
jgi:transposase